MKIAASIVTMASNHTLTQSHMQAEKLETWINDQPNSVPPQNSTDQLDLSTKAQAMLAQPIEITKEEGSEELSDKDKLKITLIEKFIELWTGKKFKFRLLDKIKTPDDTSTNIPTHASSTANPSSVRAVPNWGLRYEYHESYAESEKLSFTSTAHITTSDGREIDVAVQFNLQREFVSETHVQILAGNAKVDPLVINFGGTAAELTETKFAFDLNFDGLKEDISFVRPGSGFLALDKNSDGIINNGQELFGPQSASGFAELAKYDQDGNGWIDENDPIFNNLSIWTKDDNGQDKLFALSQQGIGAVFLGNISTEFSLNNSANSQLGQLKSTGLFLKENGTAETIQHIDLAV